MRQHTRNFNSNRADSQVDPCSNFLRILSTVMQHRLFCFENFHENTFGFFTKHGLRKTNLVQIQIRNLDESNVGFIYYELKVGGKKLIS